MNHDASCLNKTSTFKTWNTHFNWIKKRGGESEKAVCIFFFSKAFCILFHETNAKENWRPFFFYLQRLHIKGNMPTLLLPCVLLLVCYLYSMSAFPICLMRMCTDIECMQLFFKTLSFSSLKVNPVVYKSHKDVKHEIFLLKLMYDCLALKHINYSLAKTINYLSFNKWSSKENQRGFFFSCSWKHSLLLPLSFSYLQGDSFTPSLLSSSGSSYEYIKWWTKVKDAVIFVNKSFNFCSVFV